jgi:RNA polymerase sigma-70 factor (ECF subfamily)
MTQISPGGWLGLTGFRHPLLDAVHTTPGIPLVDEIAFGRFYERTAPALRSYLRTLTRDATLADDLLQESFLRFLRMRESEMNEFQMKSYLYKTATSVAIDYWRAHAHERRSQPDMAALSGPAPNSDLCHDLERVFDRLEPRQRAMLWLAYVEELRHREIAELLGIKEKSVKVVLLRARRRLAELLGRTGLAVSADSKGKP